MAVIIDNKVYVNGMAVGTVQEVEEAPRRYVLD